MAGKYRAYSEYKNSGIEWVGDIPKHWDINPAFTISREMDIKNSSGDEENVLSLSYGRIITRDVEDNFGLLPESFNTYQIVEPGDVILRLTDLQNDKRSLRVGLVKENGIITSAYLCLRNGERILPEYLYALLHSYDTTKVFYGMGGGLRQSMKFSDMRRLPLLTPPLEEQDAIVSCINRETAKIDRFIEKQQQLIELLKEKRQAVISHAVTKGLDPNVNMKDSDVEWLGEVPKHWNYAPLRRFLLDHKQGYYTTENYVEDGVKLLRITDLRDLGGIDISDCPKVPNNDASLYKYELIDGDVVFARTGGAGSFGIIMGLEERVVFASYLIRFRFVRKFYEHDYLRYMLLADSFQKAVKQNIHGGVNQNL